MKLNEGDLAYKVNHLLGVTVSQVLETSHSEAEMRTSQTRAPERSSRYRLNR